MPTDRGANLRGANLSNADHHQANFSQAHLPKLLFYKEIRKAHAETHSNFIRYSSNLEHLMFSHTSFG
ncbi:MAG: pentapeptide repeat-containing protein [Coleofasciculus sp. Co-bin14]|nr:pentapeptide repeat-containing protein [Coleofasciculus sp. Co-bin14]